MKIIAIDPGFERVGVAILEKKLRGKEVLVYSECFKTSVKIPFSERLLAIGREVARIIGEYAPEALAIESLFFTTNQKTAMGVAEARGVIVYESARKELAIFEYTPIQIKVAVTGYGRASKEDIYKMTAKLITLPNKKQIDDEVDAIAVGLTHFAYEKVKIK